MSREDAPGIRIGQQNDGACQQKTKFTLIMLPSMRNMPCKFLKMSPKSASPLPIAANSKANIIKAMVPKPIYVLGRFEILNSSKNHGEYYK